MLSDAYLVTEGVLRICSLSTEARRPCSIGCAPAVCLLSLNAAFTDGRYPANVRVETETAEIVRIPGALLRRLFGEEPAVQALVLESLTATVGELMAQLDKALLSSLRERLIDWWRAKPMGWAVATTRRTWPTPWGSAMNPSPRAGPPEARRPDRRRARLGGAGLSARRR